MHDSRIMKAVSADDLAAVPVVADAKVKKLEDELQKQRQEASASKVAAMLLLASTVVFGIGAVFGWTGFESRIDGLKTAQKNLKERETDVARLEKENSTLKQVCDTAHEALREVASSSLPTSTASDKTAEDRFYFSTKEQKNNPELAAKKKFAEEMVKSWFYRPTIGGDGIVLLRVTYTTKKGLWPAQDGQYKLTGSVIRHDGLIYILTADYVVAPDFASYQILASFDNDRWTEEADLVGSDPKAGVALLKLKNPFARYRGKVLKLAKGAPQLGSGVYIKNGTFHCVYGESHGIVIRTREDKTSAETLWHDAPDSPGSGGGPLLNINGEIIGLQHSYSRENGISYGKSIKSIRAIIPSLAKGTQK